MEGQQRVGPLVELPEVLRNLGSDPEKVIAAAGIDAGILRNPENSLSFTEVGRLLATSIAATGCPHLGLLVGSRSATRHLGLVGRLMQNAPTLEAAILDLCTNQRRYVHGSVVYLVIQHEIAFWGYAIHLPGVQAVAQICDGALAVGFNMLRELAGATPDEVLLCRRTPDDAARYRRFFGVAPRFNAEQHALAFPARWLARPVRGADPALRLILEKSVAEYWAVRQPSIVDRVIQILRARVIFPETSLENVAEDLRMHPRTLNRRLQSEGTSFRALLNEARFEVARQLLVGTKMGITDIGLTLGYADPSGFTSAFQRWSGAAPGKWRARA